MTHLKKVLVLALLLCAQSSAFFGGPRRPDMPRALQVEKRLIEIVLEGRGAREYMEQSEVFRSIEASIAELEESTANIKDYNPITADLDGTWRLLYTSSPGTNSPIQRTVTGLNGVSVFQVINIKDRSGSFLDGEADVSNTVVFDNFQARLRVTALASIPDNPCVVPRVGDGSIVGLYPFGKSSSESPRTAAERIDFAFQEAKLEAVGFPPNIYIPYPVPFKLLGDEAKGWLDQTYVSKDFRICRGNKGTCFLLQKVADISTDRSAAIATVQTSALSGLRDKKRVLGAETSSSRSRRSKAGPRFDFSSVFSSSSSSRRKTKKRKVVVIFPQQLGAESDYNDLEEQLRAILPPDSRVITVPLTRLDWPLGLLPSFFSREYREGCLTPKGALRFYLERADTAVAEAVEAVEANSDKDEENIDVEVEISVVAHSIGGWIARAWLSEWCNSSTQARVKSIVTLGSPHNEPPEGTLVAKFDQTRGLLRYINTKYPGAHIPGVNYVSIITESVKGGLVEGNPVGLLASGSYTALAGDGGASGDGIIPVSAATLSGATNIILGGRDSVTGPVYHSNFIGPVRIPNLPWYGTPDIVKTWADQL